MIHIAIVGSGPTGCFVAEFLAKKHADIQIDIFDKLPTPFGLARAGVAPDHQQTKRIIQQFERTLSRENVRFIGNIEIGKDLSYADLKLNYNAVVFATGAFVDRRLPTADPELKGVYGSAHFAGWYNSHPESCKQPPNLSGSSVAIIGNGNVALDIARILAKTETELAGSDINPEAASTIRNAEISDIYIIGRRGADHASFTNMELVELAKLENCTVVTDSIRLPSNLPEINDPGQRRAIEQNLSTLQNYAKNTDSAKPARLHLLFNYSIKSLTKDKDDQLSAITLSDNSEEGTDTTLPIQTLVTAIGYTSEAIAEVPYDTVYYRFSHHEGLIEPGVYCAGWCKRGPQGVIPTNRSDANTTGKRILADLQENTDQRQGFAAISQQFKDKQSISYEQWQLIDTAEVANADDQSPRLKFTDIDAMLKQII